MPVTPPDQNKTLRSPSSTNSLLSDPHPRPCPQGCLCHPSFGYASDKKARRCAKHRLENMEGVKGHRQKRRRGATAVAVAAAATSCDLAPSSSASLSSPLHAKQTHAGARGSGDDLAGGSGRGITRPAARAGAAPRLPSFEKIGGQVDTGGGAAAVGASAQVAGGPGGGRGRDGGMFGGGGGPVLPASSSQKTH